MPKVLIVEDNEDNRDMLMRRLLRKGYDVVMAVDGEQGVRLARQECPDIILMDMSLPVMDGWSATREIKLNSSTSAIPIIALTAHAMSSDRQKAFDVGCDEYDTKPVDMPRLLAKMSKLLSS